MVKPRVTKPNGEINPYQDNCSCLAFFVYFFLLGISVALLILAHSLPTYIHPKDHFDLSPPIIDLATKPAWTGSLCDEGYEETSSVSLARFTMPTSCICPPQSHLYVGSSPYSCSEIALSHGCVEVPSFSLPPLSMWEPSTHTRLCILRGGSPLVSLDDKGALRTRPTYDPSGSYDFCPEGFRKCGGGVCFEMGVPCPLVGYRWGSGGSFVGSSYQEFSDFPDPSPLLSLNLLPSWIEEGSTEEDLRKVISPSVCAPFFPSLPPDFVCKGGDLLCSYIANPSCNSFFGETDKPSKPKQRYRLLETHESLVEEEDLSSLEGIVYDDMWATVPFFGLYILGFSISIGHFILSHSFCKAYQYERPYSWWCPYHSQLESMREMRLWLVRSGKILAATLSFVLVFAIGSLVVTTNLYFETPLGLYKGEGKRVTLWMFVLSIIYMVLAVVFGIPHLWTAYTSATRWNPAGQELWDKEMAEEAMAKEEEAKAQKREAIYRQVSAMSLETRSQYHEALNGGPSSSGSASATTTTGLPKENQVSPAMATHPPPIPV